MREDKATSLKEFLLIYNDRKSDEEISQMLSISMEQIKREKEKIFANNTKRPENY